MLHSLRLVLILIPSFAYTSTVPPSFKQKVLEEVKGELYYDFESKLHHRCYYGDPGVEHPPCFCNPDEPAESQCPKPEHNKHAEVECTESIKKSQIL